jgi:DNA repair ATPase RecN
MFANLEEQKRNINQFYLVAQHTVTDLYRAGDYILYIEGILKKIDSLLAIYESLKPIAQTLKAPDSKIKEYAQLLNNIKIELKYLKATSEAMDDQLKKLKASEEIEHRLSGSLTELKKQVNKTLTKVEKILNDT